MSKIEELEARCRARRAAADAYSMEIREKYRRAGVLTEAERAELDRLRETASAASVELHRARQTARGHTSGG
ncbi:hypothetical protein [Streptacidiphilus sp. MAP12-33]|uniref:hypothetical protein n=1 Tax=Streptacidiphilus sp. MAP12-33 TaxID=3156266 RepID=UPI0035191513